MKKHINNIFTAFIAFVIFMIIICMAAAIQDQIDNMSYNRNQIIARSNP